MITGQWKMRTQLATFYVVASEKGLQGIFWKKQDVPLLQNLEDKELVVKIISKTIKQLEEYLDGTRKKFSIPLDISGTDFQKNVWKELLQIPYGETRSYLDIARKLNNEKAVRAVGAANGKNPVSIIVPCHRVIGKNGGLTGYAGGINIKTKLLALEKST